MLTIRRGGVYLRVADPEWSDPLDGSHARERGGRWNTPGSFPVVYVCRTVAVARANVYRLLAGQPYGPEDLRPNAGPSLVSTMVPEEEYLDVVTDRGCASAGLPTTYPRDEGGNPITHERCRPIGESAWRQGLPGVACRSAAPTAPPDGEELAHFVRHRPLVPERTRKFGDWFW